MKMITYIGDISINDAFVLKHLAEKSNSILEFGVGASTQVLRHYSNGEMDCVDTSPLWIEKTKKNLELLEISKQLNFSDFPCEIKKEYDFIFVDGHVDLRNEFGIKHWGNLKIGGYMAFHDTRQDWGIEFVSSIIKKYSTEIMDIKINHLDSNITVIKKRAPLIYENWNNVEQRSGWQYGHGEINMNEFNKLKTSNRI